jgi:hypothetical protein
MTNAKAKLNLSLRLFDTTVTEDGNVINHEEHNIISIHIGEKQRGKSKKQNNKYKTK